MQHLARFFIVLLLLVPPLANAKHVAPPAVQSITNGSVRYVVPNDKGLRAYVEAWDVSTGRNLWTSTIFTHWFLPIPPFGSECMHYEYLTSMVLADEELILTSERGRIYALNTRTHIVRRTQAKRPQ